MAEGRGKQSAPKLPALLGNVALRVSGYSSTDGITSVSGTQLSNGDPLSVELMSPARAAIMMKNREAGDDRERTRAWEARFANRRPLSEFANPSNPYGVRLGGIILLNNTRLDFNDRRYYAQGAFGFVSNPEQQAALSGTLSLTRFDDGSIRLQVYDIDRTAMLSPDATGQAQEHVGAAFRSASPVGSGTMARTAIVTVASPSDDGKLQMKAFFLRSVSFEVGQGAYQVSNGFGDTLKRSELDGNSASGAAAIAASTKVSLENVLGRMGSDTTSDDRQSVRQIYQAVVDGRSSVAITPGFTVPFVRSSIESLSKRRELFESGSFAGAVAVAFKGSDGTPLERPAAFNVASYTHLPKTPPDNLPSPARAAAKAHSDLLSADGQERPAEQHHVRAGFSRPSVLDY